jgi:hypothetical protein
MVVRLGIGQMSVVGIQYCKVTDIHTLAYTVYSLLHVYKNKNCGIYSTAKT